MTLSLERKQTHPCERQGCTALVAFDDEPFCFTHSPDSGSCVPGYSYKAAHEGEYVGRHRAAE